MKERTLKAAATTVFFVLALILSPHFVFAEEGDDELPTGALPGQGSLSRIAIDSDLISADIEIPMRDGQSLAATTYRPKNVTTQVPVVLIMTPYDRRRMAVCFSRVGARSPIYGWREVSFCIVDWRGFYGSRGAGRGVAAMKQRGEDGYDTVEWLAEQSWCSGKVGMIGASALGQVQFATASERPPHLACIVPHVASYGQDFDRYYVGGVLREDYVSSLDRLGFGVGTLVRSHPTEDIIWRGASRSNDDVLKVNVPMLVVGGWYDLDTKAVIDNFIAMKRGAGEVTKSHSHLLVGPWVHETVDQKHQGDLEFEDCVFEAANTGKRFFQRWLFDPEARGLPGEEPVVRFYRINSGQWFSSNQWPPPGDRRARDHSLFLTANGELADSALSAGTAQYKSDPSNPVPSIGGAMLGHTVRHGPRDQNDVEKREDVITFTTPALDEDVDLTGEAKLQAFVSADTSDADVIVRLCDVHPDGTSYLVADGAQRLSYRQSTQSPTAIRPGEVYEIEIPLQITAIRFPKGHKIRISVSGTSDPRFAVGTNVFPAARTQANTLASVTIHTGGQRASRLILTP
ncbi:MAG: CocE/NonD family hydrolase [Planctomycetes bacterium]|nr:CocE/NonD family hydrolase [Planctomycetota bacterium]